MKFSIVIPYYNRRQLLLNTLRSILYFKGEHEVETIIVDDGSDEAHAIMDVPALFPKLNINLIVLERDLGWRVPCIAYNTGFNSAKGDIILINSAECMHVGYILDYVVRNLTAKSYISFSTYEGDANLNLKFNELDFKSPVLYDLLINTMVPMTNNWQSHTRKNILEQTYIPFCAAINRKDMELLSGYDERFVNGIGYDDYDFTDRIKNLKLKISLIDNPFVVHQWHQPTVFSNTINLDFLWKIRKSDPERIKAVHNTIYNKSNLYLCTHYGFGDYVICYGLVKELAKKHDTVFLFGIPHRSPLHIDNIKRLYSSIKNVEIVTDDPKSYEDVLYLGWQKYTDAIKIDRSIIFAKFYYEQVGVPLNLLWDNFYFKRDMKKEKEIYYDILGLKDKEEYFFLHEDPFRHFVINRKYITPNIKVINLVELEDISILDVLYLVEKAKEVHIINTGLVSFIDQMNIKHNNLNFHKYVRPSAFEQPILRLKWNIIK